MLTPRGAAFAVGAVLLWALGRLLGVAELYVVAAATGALVLVGVVAVRLGSSTISARRGVNTTRLHHGATTDVTIDLRNDARWDPAPLLLVEDSCHWSLASQPRFTVSGVKPGEVVRLTYPIEGAHRGRYTVGPLRLRVRDPFGAIQQVRRYTTTDDVVVYPQIEPVPPGLTRGMHLGSGASEERRLYNAGDEFHTMREYVQGDDLRLVHWPSTAKQHTLMVRQQELPWQAEATVLLDNRARSHRGAGPDSTFEKAVSVAASVIWHLARRGYQLRLVTATDVAPPGRTSSVELLDRLAEITPARSEHLLSLPGLRHSGEGLLIAVLAPAAGDAPVPRHPELHTLSQAARGCSSRTGLVVHERERAERARDTAALLRVAGWRAASVAVDEALADRGGDVAPPAVSRAFQPDAASAP